MAPKRIIPEVCPRCGAVQASLESDGSVTLNHACPKAPPGPPKPPKRFRPGEVDFRGARREERLPDGRTRIVHQNGVVMTYLPNGAAENVDYN
jgi:hypothetical protein